MLDDKTTIILFDLSTLVIKPNIHKPTRLLAIFNSNFFIIKNFYNHKHWKEKYPIMVILREDLRGSWESKRESSASLEPTLGYRSFWRLGNTLVSSQIRRFNSPTVSSPQTRTVYSFPLHFTVRVSSSSDTVDVDAVEAMTEATAIPNFNGPTRTTNAAKPFWFSEFVQ